MTTSLRILHAVCTDEFAGVEQFIARLAVAQAAAGHDVSVAGGDPARMRPLLAANRIPFASVSSTTQTVRAIRARLGGLDIVNSHLTAADSAAIVALSGAHPRPALVSTRHIAKRRGRLAPLDPLLAPRIDAEVAISGYVARQIGVPSTVVHPGVSPRADVDPATRQPVVLMAQRLQPEKHSLLGIRAFAASGLATHGWTLEIAGDGPERDPAQRLAADLGVSHAVSLLGFRDDVPALMARASILLATCPIEGFGLTVLEAMAAGLPITTPSVGGPAEMVSGLDPRATFGVDDAGHAAAQLRSLADDEAGRVAYGEAARARQRERFTVEAQAVQTDAVYRTALDLRRSRRGL